MKQILLSLLALLFLSSCGGSSSSSESGGTTEEMTDSTLPPVIDDTFGSGGNLYKPVSDGHSSGGGNVVVLFDRKYTKRMDGCSIPLADGTRGVLVCIDNEPWTQTPFSCFSNNSRQTWRAGFKCNEVGEVVVSCRRGDQRYRFSAPGGATGNVCSRFG